MKIHKTMLTFKETIDTLKKLGHEPNRLYGQNFLVDKNIVLKTLQIAKLATGEAVVEVGPGLGTLTSALLEAGARLTSIEKDAHLLPYLRETFPSERYPLFTLMHADATEVDYNAFNFSAATPLPLAPKGKGFKVVANLPYAVATPLMEKFLLGRPVSMTLMVQRELAERWAAAGGKAFSAFSIFLQSAYDLGKAGGIAHPVGRKCFFPAPKVDSALVHYTLKPKPIVFPPERQRLVRGMFLNRRKQLRKAAEANPVSAAWFGRLLEEGKIKPTARAEEIELALWQRLAE